MLAGALSDSPMWLPWACYWTAWAFVHAAWWWVSTTTRHVEAIAPAASVVYWAAVWWLIGLGGWGWQATKRSYGVREAVDFGSGTSRLGRTPRTVIQWQTRTRVWVATWGLLVGYVGAVLLLAVGLLGAWSVFVVVAAVLAKVNRERRRARWSSP